MNDRDVYLVDSSVWIAAYRRNPPQDIVSRLSEILNANLGAINDIIRLEILIGVRSDDERRVTEDSLNGYRQLSLDAGTWSGAAAIGAALRKDGLSILIPDLVIAANAISHDAVLLHRDSDFEQIATRSALRTEYLQ